MLRALAWMFKLPASAMVAGMQALTSALKEVQQLFDRGLHGATNGSNLSIGTPDEAFGKSSSLKYADELHKEDDTMDDQDLSGDDLKYVSYSILFTKRDYEVTLAQQTEYLVNYSTDGASFASIMMIQFASAPFNRPLEWMRDNLYPPDIPSSQTTLRVSEIPTEDQRYLTFIYSVERRMPRNAKDYDKRTVQVLGEIRDRL